MTQESVSISLHYWNPDCSFPVSGDSSSVVDSQVWFNEYASRGLLGEDNRPMDGGQSVARLPSRSDMRWAKQTASVPVTARLDDSGLVEGSSDECTRRTEESPFEGPDKSFFEYDMAVQMPYKERFKVDMTVRSVRKGEPPKVDPGWLI